MRFSLDIYFRLYQIIFVVYYLHTHACVFRRCQLKETTTVETVRLNVGKSTLKILTLRDTTMTLAR